MVKLPALAPKMGASVARPVQAAENAPVTRAIAAPNVNHPSEGVQIESH